MTNFRILRPPALLLATVAKAAVIVAPLENETSITKVARAAARAAGAGHTDTPYGHLHCG